jgi:hypothetical protein
MTRGEQIRHYVNAFDALLAEAMPKLHAHFAALGIAHDIYLLDWCV